MIGGPRTRVFVMQDSTDHREARVFRAHTTPQGTCDNLTNVVKLLTNQQKDGDSSVGKIVSGLLENSRSRMMDGVWKFTAVDNHEAVKVGDLHRETKSKKVEKPKHTTVFRGAVIREGADELTLRAHEEGVLRTCIDTSNVGDQRWEPPLIDADWHAFCQAIFPRNRRTRVGCHVFSIHGLAPSGEKARNLERMEKGTVLWAMKKRSQKQRVDNYDTNHKKSDESPTQVGFVGYSPERPNGRLGKSVGRSRTG